MSVPRRAVVAGFVIVLVSTLGGALGTGLPASEASSQHPYVGPTYVLLPAGHVGGSTLGARDSFWWNPDLALYEHVGGLICQVPPGASPCPPIPPQYANDPSYRVFCGGVTLRSEFWSAGLDTYVWVGYDRLAASAHQDYGVFCEQHRPPTTGYVWHWP